ncbi:DUF6233 domain-containing protein [Streptomyces sp. NPDC017941]|uniref:DUF6233 domain-containing protein n=1 Tax=unclassified Streptomyces TaxID=2593676 RepID=UPI00378845FF
MGEEHRPVQLLLPDGQEVAARVYERQETAGGWRYLTGVPLWRNVVDSDGGIEAAEYRVWLSADQVRPLDGVTYDIPTYRLPTAAAPPDTRWAWSVQRLRDRHRRPAGAIVHEYDCEDAPRGEPELNLDQALDALQRPGARACKTCSAAEVLQRFL